MFSLTSLLLHGQFKISNQKVPNLTSLLMNCECWNHKAPHIYIKVVAFLSYWLRSACLKNGLFGFFFQPEQCFSLTTIQPEQCFSASFSQVSDQRTRPLLSQPHELTYLYSTTKEQDCSLHWIQSTFWDPLHFTYMQLYQVILSILCAGSIDGIKRCNSWPTAAVAVV